MKQLGTLSRFARHSVEAMQLTPKPKMTTTTLDDIVAYDSLIDRPIRKLSKCLKDGDLFDARYYAAQITSICQTKDMVGYTSHTVL